MKKFLSGFLALCAAFTMFSTTVVLAADAHVPRSSTIASQYIRDYRRDILAHSSSTSPHHNQSHRSSNNFHLPSSGRYLIEIKEVSNDGTINSIARNAYINLKHDKSGTDPMVVQDIQTGSIIDVGILTYRSNVYWADPSNARKQGTFQITFIPVY